MQITNEALECVMLGARIREREKIIKLLEKYRLATGKVGQLNTANYISTIIHQIKSWNK